MAGCRLAWTDLGLEVVGMHSPAETRREIPRPAAAVIPSAGWGTRLLPLTKAVPKEMVPIVDTPAIHLVVEEAVRAGIEDVVIVTSRHKRCIEDYFDSAPELESFLTRTGRGEVLGPVRRLTELASFHFVRQPEPAGLGHAVSLARRHVGHRPFAVLLPDVVVAAEPPCLTQMLRRWRGETLVAVHEVAREDVRRYGIVVPAQGARMATGRDARRRVPAALDPAGAVSGRVANLVEKPDPRSVDSRLAVTGRYIFHPDIFAALEETPPDARGELQLTDALRLLLSRRPVSWVRFRGAAYDVGHPLGLLEANLAFASVRLGLSSPGGWAGRGRPGHAEARTAT